MPQTLHDRATTENQYWSNICAININFNWREGWCILCRYTSIAVWGCHCIHEAIILKVPKFYWRIEWCHMPGYDIKSAANSQCSVIEIYVQGFLWSLDFCTLAWAWTKFPVKRPDADGDGEETYAYLPAASLSLIFSRVHESRDWMEGTGAECMNGVGKSWQTLYRVTGYVRPSSGYHR